MVKYPFKMLGAGKDVLRHQYFAAPSYLKFEASIGQTRRKLWDLSGYLHCSVIGTCLTANDLRRIVVKAAGSHAQTWSDHDIHKEGARLASRNDALGKLLHKSLDTRHAAILRKFTPAKTGQDILALWKAVKGEGDIPGGYWACVTHPATDEATLRHVFGEVHMLSHLVGSANRADVRRLAELEAEVSALNDKVARQEKRIQMVALERDEKARAYDALVTERLLEQRSPQHIASSNSGLTGATDHFRVKLESQTIRLAALEKKQQAWRDERQRLSLELERLSRSEAALIEELGSLEDMIQRLQGHETPEQETRRDLSGVRFLYVGGRTHHIATLQAEVQKTGATLLHHDGGQSEALSLLPGLISQAQFVLFPLDCVGHNAVSTIKKFCKQAEKPYIPLPRSGLGSLLRALEHVPGPEQGRF
jgi:hypothetical protein